MIDSVQSARSATAERSVTETIDWIGLTDFLLASLKMLAWNHGCNVRDSSDQENVRHTIDRSRACEAAKNHATLPIIPLMSTMTK